MIPVLALLAFSTWTLLSVMFTVGIYRWHRTLTGRVEIGRWHGDDLEIGNDFYRRAMRAHANCIENLPVFAAIVLVLVALDIQAAWLDRLSVTVVVARIAHTLVHVAFTQTNMVASFRFLFFFIQLLAMLGMTGIVVGELLAN